MKILGLNICILIISLKNYFDSINFNYENHSQQKKRPDIPGFKKSHNKIL